MKRKFQNENENGSNAMTYFERETAVNARKSNIYTFHSDINVSRSCNLPHLM